MAFHHLDEIVLGEAGEGRAAEVRVLRQVIFRADGAVGKITAATAGNPNALPGFVAMVEQQHAPPALTGLCRAHHAGGTGADYDDVE